MKRINNKSGWSSLTILLVVVIIALISFCIFLGFVTINAGLEFGWYSNEFFGWAIVTLLFISSGRSGGSSK